MSTGSVYGASDKKYLFEEGDKTENSNFYVGSKIAAESLILPYQKNLDVKILRLFTPYGEGQDESFLIPRLIKNIQTGKKITLANCTGPFLTPIYVDDACKSIRFFVENETKEVIYNLSGTEVLSLKEIVDILSDKIGREANIVDNIKKGEEYVCGDNNKIRGNLGDNFSDLREI